MKISLHNKDIVSVSEAETIVLPVDGSGPGMEGGVARRFMRYAGVEQMDDLYSTRPSYPFNGGCHWTTIEPFDTHFTHMCCLGIQSHRIGADHGGYLRSAFNLMLRDAGTRGDVGRNVVCPILTGGNRLKIVDSIYIMLAEVDMCMDLDVELHIAEKDTERFEILQGIARC